MHHSAEWSLQDSTCISVYVAQHSAEATNFELPPACRRSVDSRSSCIGGRPASRMRVSRLSSPAWVSGLALCHCLLASNLVVVAKASAVAGGDGEDTIDRITGQAECGISGVLANLVHGGFYPFRTQVEQT